MCKPTDKNIWIYDNADKQGVGRKITKQSFTETNLQIVRCKYCKTSCTDVCTYVNI